MHGGPFSAVKKIYVIMPVLGGLGNMSYLCIGKS